MTEKETKNRNIRDFPEDLLVEILSRVPATSLARSCSTSKGWNALIKKHRRLLLKFQIMLIDFCVYLASIDLNGVHDDNVFKLTRQLSLKDPLSTSPKEVNIREVFHCDGLLLCSTMAKRLVVWNPCSGETRWMIQPINSYFKTDTYALGKSSCNKYKILRVHHHGPGHWEPCLVDYEIYDFTCNSWRVVGETREWAIPGMWRRGTSVDGNTYWLAFTFSQDRMRDILLSFDFSRERFESVSLPVDDDLSYRPLALSVTRGDQKLCLLATRKEQKLGRELLDVWIATKIESTGAMSWRKFLTLERSYHSRFFTFCTEMSFLADQEKNVLVCPGKNAYGSAKVSNSFLHVVGEDKHIEVDHRGAGSKCSLLVSYVPTLVQIQ